MNPLTNVKNIQKLNETELKLGVHGKKSWHDQYKDSAWVFIGGLPYDLSEGDIICVFSQYGEIVNINLVRDGKTGNSKGYAFLCYEDQKSTILAVDNLNGFKLLKRTLRVDHVENYRQPKEYGNEDEVTKKTRAEGVAPKTPSASEEDELLPTEGISKKMKKKKKKKDKKRKKGKKKSHSSDSEESETQSSSSFVKRMKTEGPQVEVKKEKNADFYHEIKVKRECGYDRRHVSRSSDTSSEDEDSIPHKSRKKRRNSDSSASHSEISGQMKSLKKRDRRRNDSSCSSSQGSARTSDRDLVSSKYKYSDKTDSLYRGSPNDRRDSDYTERDSRSKIGRNDRYREDRFKNDRQHDRIREDRFKDNWQSDRYKGASNENDRQSNRYRNDKQSERYRVDRYEDDEYKGNKNSHRHRDDFQTERNMDNRQNDKYKKDRHDDRYRNERQSDRYRR